MFVETHLVVKWVHMMICVNYYSHHTNIPTPFNDARVSAQAEQLMLLANTKKQSGSTLEYETSISTVAITEHQLSKITCKDRRFS